MIPTIETIVEDLLAGTITKQQAIGWLQQHAAEADNFLRDEFAGKAMQGMCSTSQWPGSGDYVEISKRAYQQADAMLKERAK